MAETPSSAADGTLFAVDFAEGKDLLPEWRDAWGRASGCIWVHMDRSSDSAAQWLRTESGLDARIVDELLAESTRPCTLSEPESALVVLRGVNLNPGADPDDMISLRLWADGRHLITMRGARLFAVESVHEECLQGRAFESTGDVVLSLIDHLTSRMTPVIRDVGSTIDEYEDRVVDPNETVERLALVRTRQRIIRLQRYLGPQVTALQELRRKRPGSWAIQDDEQLSLSINAVSRLVEDLEAARGRAVVLQDELANQMAQQANERVYAVTLIAAVFLPLTLVSGILGMNVGGIPLASNSLGFIIVTVLLAALGIIGFLWLRRSRWL